MLFSILCYHNEKVVGAWSAEEDAATMARLDVVHRKLAHQGQLGPIVRLMPTGAAVTLRKDREPPVMFDGPFAETKEQLLGFYIYDCLSQEEAIAAARELGRANPGGAYEIRPIAVFKPHGAESSSG